MRKLLLFGLVFVAAAHADTFIPVFPTAATGNHLIPSLLAYWKFDEASGNALDASGNGRTLTEATSVAAGTGVVNGSRLFSNANDGSHLNVNYFSRASESAFIFSGPFTLTVWANMTTAAFGVNDMAIIAKATSVTGGDLSWMLAYDHASPNDFFHFLFSSDGTYDPARSADFTLSGGVGAIWYFLVVRWDGATIHLSATEETELTVEADVTKAWAGPFYSSASPLEIGALSAESLNGFNGDMDEIGIWSRYLSDCEVAKLFTAKAGTFSYPSFDSNTCAP